MRSAQAYTPELDPIVIAALQLAAERSWRDVTLLDIAAASGRDLADLRQHISSKSDILAAYTAKIDARVLKEVAAPQPDQVPRDALFEVLMARFDAMQDDRAALKSITEANPADPSLLRTLMGSQAWMLHAAGIDAEGLDGGVRVAGLTSIYLSVFRTWLDDEDPGQARTMAALDRKLRRGERSMSTVNGVFDMARRMGDMVRSRTQSSRNRGKSPEAKSAPDSDFDAPIET